MKPAWSFEKIFSIRVREFIQFGWTRWVQNGIHPNFCHQLRAAMLFLCADGLWIASSITTVMPNNEKQVLLSDNE